MPFYDSNEFTHSCDDHLKALVTRSIFAVLILARNGSDVFVVFPLDNEGRIFGGDSDLYRAAHSEGFAVAGVVAVTCTGLESEFLPGADAVRASAVAAFPISERRELERVFALGAPCN